MPDEVLHTLPTALLEVSVLLGIAVLFGLLAQRVHIPVTVVLALAGILVVELGFDSTIAGFVAGAGFKALRDSAW
jgi:CPA1 family monovalent cation:H+ antiporter